MVGLRTIRQGNRVAVWYPSGRVQYVDGPRRIWSFRRRLESLQRFSAEADEYLVVRHKDGHADHLRGPVDAWFTPVEHESIDVRKVVLIDANEALVIYARADNGLVDRRVLRGPAQVMPQPNEWLHQFRWHGADKNDPRHKVPRALQFTKLRVIPDQTYVDVSEVRTSDDALLTVQVMIFFELIDIERMLDQTHDPVADFVNAVTADVIDFAASRPFELFKRDTEQLNDLAAYPNLTARAQRIGYQINKVVYRGYQANPKLQEMHDNAIEARTALQLESETEQQAQELADLRLSRKAERARQQREVDRERTEHAQRMKQMAHEQTLREQDAEHKLEFEFKQNLNAIELQHSQAENAERTALLRSMQEMQIDLTRYLVAQYQNPDRLIHIDGGPEQPPQLHLHDQ